MTKLPDAPGAVESSRKGVSPKGWPGLGGLSLGCSVNNAVTVIGLMGRYRWTHYSFSYFGDRRCRFLFVARGLRLLLFDFAERTCQLTSKEGY